MIIQSLADVRPGDLFLGPIGGWVGAGVALGELLVDGGFRMGSLDVRHVGVVVAEFSPAKAPQPGFPDGRGSRPPRMVQAMPGGAAEIEMTEAKHWTPRCAYVRLEQDYPGQALDAAAVARLMVEHGVAYSPLSYGALAAWSRGLSTPKLEAWINRRQYYPWSGNPAPLPSGRDLEIGLPVEAIAPCWATRRGA